MNRKPVSGIMFTLLLIGMLTLALNIEPVRASGTICIRADGSIDPPTAPIQRVGNIYTLTDDIYNESIRIEAHDIIVDGNGHTLEGTKTLGTYGFDLSYGIPGPYNVSIKNTVIKGWFVAIFGGDKYATISNNTIIDNSGEGIMTYGEGIRIINNTLANNGWSGLNLGVSSKDCKVSGNKVAGNGREGIVLKNAESITIDHNTITDNGGTGIYMYYSKGYTTDSIVNDNIVADNSRGINLYYSSGWTIKGNVVVNNSREGIYLESSNLGNITANTITNNHSGIDIYRSNRNNIWNNTVTNKVTGIGLHDSNYNNVGGNTISDNGGIGIDIHLSYANNISWNDLANNGHGIHLYTSEHSNLSGNYITANKGYGILLEGASLSITLRNNTMARNKYNFGVLNPWDFSNLINDVDVSNTVDGKPIYYWIDRRDMAVPLDAGYLALVNCDNITVRNLNLTNNGQGVLLAHTTNSTITKNDISNNDYGVWLDYSSNGNTILYNDITNNAYGIDLTSSAYNIIAENNITANSYGVRLYFSPDNKLYHNNFVDNIQQVYVPVEYATLNTWDDGYPSGGNYWSDYMGVDVKRGPNQNQPGSDGIGDTPYIITENNTDRYPLIYPLGYIPGPDISNDGIVDIFDLVLVAIAYNSRPGGTNWNCYCDLNEDGIVDIFDLVIVAGRYEETYL